MPDGTPWAADTPPLRNYGNNTEQMPRGRVSETGGGSIRVTLEVMGTAKKVKKSKPKSKPEHSRPKSARHRKMMETVPEHSEVDATNVGSGSGDAAAAGARENEVEEPNHEVVRNIFSHDLASMIELAFEQLEGDANKQRRWELLNTWWRDLVGQILDLTNKKTNLVRTGGEGGGGVGGGEWCGWEWSWRGGES